MPTSKCLGDKDRLDCFSDGMLVSLQHLLYRKGTFFLETRHSARCYIGGTMV